MWNFGQTNSHTSKGLHDTSISGEQLAQSWSLMKSLTHNHLTSQRILIVMYDSKFLQDFKVLIFNKPLRWILDWGHSARMGRRVKTAKRGSAIVFGGQLVTRGNASCCSDSKEPSEGQYPEVCTGYLLF
ncbi:hypothetical protein NC652_019941 [Populus alba x Populus x berolinensis]|nr:hypothetical protein NC652_019941 [Populus alba x Populus x berolinensis]